MIMWCFRSIAVQISLCAREFVSGSRQTSYDGPWICLHSHAYVVFVHRATSLHHRTKRFTSQNYIYAYWREVNSLNAKWMIKIFLMFWMLIIWWLIDNLKQGSNWVCKTGIKLGMGSTNERRRYIVTSSLIGWAHAQNDSWEIMTASETSKKLCLTF